jgi:hypothetical protein
MSGKGILDADMTTVAGWLRDGWRWWVDELAALVPDRWRALGRGRAEVARFDGTHLTGAAPGKAVAVAVASELCLVRVVERPALSERDVARMLAFEADRILPMPAETMVAAGRIVAREGATMRLAVAGLPRARADALAGLIVQQRARPVRVFVDHPAGAIELLPALRDAGYLGVRHGAARGWWAAVAFLFVLNVGLLIWRDAARNQRLQEVVDAQAPAVAVSRAMTGRVRTGQRVALVTARRRAAYDPLGVLARVSGGVPGGTWAQRYGWTGDTLKLAGYRRRDANVVAALRALPGFVEVRNTNTDSVAEVPAGQPFDVSARLAGGERR